jgi:hypothetical protein
MYDTDALERINVEQLVTATDRLLFGNVRKRRPTRPTTDLTAVARIAVANSARRNDERTIYMRGNTATSRLALLGAAAAIAWLTVAVVCLLA